MAHEEHRTLGETVSELLGIGIRIRGKKPERQRKHFTLKTFSMGSPNIPLEDKEAILSAVEKRQA
jgi:hypothetical protein